MDVTDTWVRHVARLARLELDDVEVAEMQPKLKRIFELMDRVKNLPVRADESAQVPPIHFGALRPDEIEPPLPPSALTRNAPASDGSWLVVPHVFEQGAQEETPS